MDRTIILFLEADEISSLAIVEERGDPFMHFDSDPANLLAMG
jgi:hypothetical protein